MVFSQHKMLRKKHTLDCQFGLVMNEKNPQNRSEENILMSDSKLLDDCTSTLDSLSSLLSAQDAKNIAPKIRRIPPLEKWFPKNCGTMDLVIKANGEWWHEGRQMTRQSMIDLFSSVLWTEDVQGEPTYFLKTPVEKIGIRVEDAPLLITQVNTIEKEGKTYLEFITPHDDRVIADDDHPIIFRLPPNATANTAPQPYILVRQNGSSKLYGLIHRNVFYHLINLGELSETSDKTGTQTCLTLRSGDSVFHLSMPNL